MTPEQLQETDIETLKAWCLWKKKGGYADEDEIEFIKTIEDLISQVGTFKAERDKLRKQVEELEEELAELLGMK